MVELGLSHDDQKKRFGSTTIPAEYVRTVFAPVSPIEEYLDQNNDHAILSLLYAAHFNAMDQKGPSEPKPKRRRIGSGDLRRVKNKMVCPKCHAPKLLACSEMRDSKRRKCGVHEARIEAYEEMIGHPLTQSSELS